MEFNTGGQASWEASPLASGQASPAGAPTIPNFNSMTFEQVTTYMAGALGQLVNITNHTSQQINIMQQEITQQAGQIALLRAEVDTITQNIPQQIATALAALPNNTPATTTGLTNASGSGQNPPLPQATVPGSAFKLAKPVKFDGTKREESSKFELACRMYVRAVHPNATAEAKVAFIFSLLEGTARDWLEPYMESDLLLGHRVPFLHDDALFWDQFKNRYGMVNRDENNRANLKALKQKGSVQEYLGLFQTYAATLGYNDVALRDMFYEGLSDEIINDMVSQDFEPLGNTTFQQVAERALKIDKRRRPAKKQTSTSTRATSVTSTTTTSTREQFNKGDKVYMIGTDGRAKKGTIAEITKNAKGKTAPKVQWNGETTATTVPFATLRRDTRPALPATASTPGLAKGSGPGPMELDGKGKGVLLCHVCGGRGHFARDCPSRNVSGHEAKISEVGSDEEEEESLKGDA